MCIAVLHVQEPKRLSRKALEYVAEAVTCEKDVHSYALGTTARYLSSPFRTSSLRNLLSLVLGGTDNGKHLTQRLHEMYFEILEVSVIRKQSGKEYAMLSRQLEETHETDSDIDCTDYLIVLGHGKCILIPRLSLPQQPTGYL